jgi:hypothetical protein
MIHQTDGPIVQFGDFLQYDQVAGARCGARGRTPRRLRQGALDASAAAGGALAGKKASKGIFITTSSFNDNATAYAAGLNQKIIIIDGRRLSELMIEHGIGVAEEHAYSVKKIDSDYFEAG